MIYVVFFRKSLQITYRCWLRWWRWDIDFSPAKKGIERISCCRVEVESSLLLRAQRLSILLRIAPFFLVLLFLLSGSLWHLLSISACIPTRQRNQLFMGYGTIQRRRLGEVESLATCGRNRLERGEDGRSRYEKNHTLAISLKTD